MAETNVDFVPLERDLEHLRHFVALHQMRLTAKTPVSFKVEGDLSAHRIAPLLLLPFVENAFKFGTSAREESPIDISVKIEGNVLEFICQNHIRSTISDSTGIGIANTRRRLDLLYAGRYVLEIRERAGLFRVELKIGM
jgi:LytS/YehU family sensor histidine kinase